MKIFMIILCFCFFCNGDDPPKKKKEIKKDTIYPQEQRSINIKELEQLNKMFDSLNQKQDTLIKK